MVQTYEGASGRCLLRFLKICRNTGVCLRKKVLTLPKNLAVLTGNDKMCQKLVTTRNLLEFTQNPACKQTQLAQKNDLESHHLL